MQWACIRTESVEHASDAHGHADVDDDEGPANLQGERGIVCE